MDVWITPIIKITNDKLNIYLDTFGYDPALITPGLWWHQTHHFQFLLVVDNFGVKYEFQEEITHLLNALKNYKMSEDWDGKLYYGLNLKWDYYKQEVLVSMPNYVTKSLH